MASFVPPEKAPSGKPLTVGSRHDPAEREADRIADLLTAPEEPALPVCAACEAGGAPCAACGGGGGGVLRRQVAGELDGGSGGEMVAPPSVHQALREPGEPLPGGIRETFERRLGVDLAAVRVHESALASRSAQEIHARAYTSGNDIVLGSGLDRTGARGAHLLSHELAHHLQQRNQGSPSSLVQRNDEEEEPTTPEAVVEQESEDLGLGAAGDRTFPFRFAPRRPELFVVPLASSRGDIAARLFGDERRQRAFDRVILAPPPQIEGMAAVTVQVREGEAAPLVAEARAALEHSLEAALRVDVDWTVAKLSEARIDDDDERALIERTLRWSQHSEIQDAAGTSWFDRYLNGLQGVSLVQPHWYTLTLTETRHSALEWLLIETGERSEQIHKAIALRSRLHTTSYRVTDQTPSLGEGDVIGRFAWSDGGTIQVLVRHQLVNEESAVRAEIATRNAPWTGMKAMVPGTNGRFYGYALTFPSILGNTHPLADPGGRFYWYRPRTLFITGGEYQPEVVQGGPQEQQFRESLAARALASATAQDPGPILGLDYDVLLLLTAEQRLAAFRLIFEGSAIETAAGVAFLARLVGAVPADSFRQFERLLWDRARLNRLLASDAETKVMLGQAFTARALEVFPVSLGDLASLPSFTVGREGETHHMLDVPTYESPTTLVAGEDWNPQAGVSLAEEPIGPGQTPGPGTRTALAFRPVRSESHLRYLRTTHGGAESRRFHPLELVRLEIPGPQPQTQIVTALELACVASISNWDLLFSGINRIIEAWAIYGAGRGLGRAFGPAFTRGLAAGGLRAGLRGVVAEAGTVGGRAALQQFAVQTALLGSMGVVDSYRQELVATPAGRRFLAVFDVSLMILAGRDLYRLASSGALRQLALSGRALLVELGAGARRPLAEAIESIQAAEIAWQRLAAARQLVAETVGGVRTLRPVDEASFRHLFFSVRAELAATRAVGAVRAAGLSSARTEELLRRLQQLAAGNEELSRGFSAVARRAAALPAAEIEAYVAGIEALRAARPTATAAFGELMRASAAGRVADRAAFLRDARWLFGITELGDEGLAVMARKVREAKLDLAWLRTTTLNPREIAFLGRDPGTAWDLIRRAAANPENLALQRLATSRLRGMAGEWVTQETIARLFPEFRISGRQVRMGGSVVDFELMARGGTGMRHALEVKGWDPSKWRNALNAWAVRVAEIRAARPGSGTPTLEAITNWRSVATALTEEQQRLVGQMRDLARQLGETATHSRGSPFLVVTDGLSRPTRVKLDAFVNGISPRFEIRTINEAEILAAGRRFRQAFGLPAPVVPTPGPGAAPSAPIP